MLACEAVLHPLHRCGNGGSEGKEPPGIPAAGRMVSALSLGRNQNIPGGGPKTSPREVEPIRPSSDSQSLSPCLKAAAASPAPWPSAPGQWLLWGQELVRHPGRMREAGWHQPPWCPLRNWRAQPKRLGMSQPPCQGQQEVTSTAIGLSPSSSPGPQSPGARAPWCFLCLGPACPPTGSQRERSLGPAPPLPQLAAACQTWVCGAEVSCLGLWAQSKTHLGQPPNPGPCGISPSACPKHPA